MPKRLLLIFAMISILLAGCGSSPLEDFERRVGQAMRAPVSVPSAALPMGSLRRVAFSAPTGSDSESITPDQLFDWAEATYPQFFPSREKTLTWSNYQFRYYKDTDVYLAVENGTKVVALGKPTGNEVVVLGEINNFSKVVTQYKPWTNIQKRADIVLSSIGIQTGESTYQIIKAADLNSDGYDDLIITGQSLYPGIPLVSDVAPNVPFHRLPVLLLYYNPKTEKFEPNPSDDKPLMYTGTSASVQDWNRDGLPDILIIGSGPDQGPHCGEPMILLLNTANGFRNRSDLLPQINIRRDQIVEIDLDQDNYKDLYLFSDGWIVPDRDPSRCPYAELPGVNKELEILNTTRGIVVNDPWWNPVSRCGSGPCQMMGHVVRDFDLDGKPDVLITAFDTKTKLSRIEIYLNKGRSNQPSQFVLAQASDWADTMMGAVTIQNNTLWVRAQRSDYSQAHTRYYDLTSLKEQTRTALESTNNLGCVEFSDVDLDNDGQLDLVCRNLVSFTETINRSPRAWLNKNGKIEAIDLSLIPIGHGQSFQSINLKGLKQFVYLGPFMSHSPNITIYTLQ